MNPQQPVDHKLLWSIVFLAVSVTVFGVTINRFISTSQNQSALIKAIPVPPAYVPPQGTRGTVLDSVPPTIKITSPGKVTVSGTIVFEVEAKDTDNNGNTRPVKYVKFYIDGKEVASLTQAPYRIYVGGSDPQAIPIALGKHKFSAKTEDLSGHIATEDPEVTVTSPTVTQINGIPHFTTTFVRVPNTTYTIQKTYSLTPPDWININSLPVTERGIVTDNPDGTITYQAPITCDTCRSTGYYKITSTPSVVYNPGDTVWSISTGTTGPDFGNAITADSSGNIVIGGGGNSRSFIETRSPTGALIWQKNPPSGDGRVFAITTDSTQGNIYATGAVYGAADFSGGTNPNCILGGSGGYDIFVVKYSNDGNCLWAKGYGTLSLSAIIEYSGYGIAVDKRNGDVIVTGIMAGAIDFGGGSLGGVSSQDVFFLKLNSSGNHIWSKSLTGTGTKSGVDVKIDVNGNMFFTGRFAHTVDFGFGPVTASGGADMYLAKYSPSGALQWVNHYGTRTPYISQSGAQSLALDPSGNPVVVGTYKFPMNIGGPTPLPTWGSDEIFVAKYNGATGAYIWSKGFGTDAPDSGPGITTDSNGNVIISAFSAYPLNFGGGDTGSPGYGLRASLASFNSNDGSHRWSKAYAIGSGDINRLTSDSLGNIFAVGRFYPNIDLGKGVLTSMGSTDIFLVKVAPGRGRE